MIEQAKAAGSGASLVSDVHLAKPEGLHKRASHWPICGAAAQMRRWIASNSILNIATHWAIFVAFAIPTQQPCARCAHVTTGSPSQAKKRITFRVDPSIPAASATPTDRTFPLMRAISPAIALRRPCTRPSTRLRRSSILSRRTRRPFREPPNCRRPAHRDRLPSAAAVKFGSGL